MDLSLFAEVMITHAESLKELTQEQKQIKQNSPVTYSNITQLYKIL